MKFRVVCVSMVMAFSLAACGNSDDSTSSAKYPTGAVTWIVPFAAGGPGDLTARVYAEYATKALGKPVTVQNVEGGSGITGALQAIKSKPDGYTLFVDSQSTGPALAASFDDLPFKLDERTYISEMAEQYRYFVVNTKSSITTLKQAMELAKSDPAKFSWAAGAAGSSVEYGTLQLLHAAGVPIQQTRKVTFQAGLAESAAAVASGQVLFGTLSEQLAASLSSAHKVRILAVAADERQDKHRDVPTAAELGYGGTNLILFQALAGPPKLPDSVVKVWEKVIKDAAADPEVQKKAADLGTTFSADRDKSGMESFVNENYDQLLELAKATGKRS
jgi:tripartite-type tricarboxylate transporter receptor subunit TctC